MRPAPSARRKIGVTHKQANAAQCVSAISQCYFRRSWFHKVAFCSMIQTLEKQSFSGKDDEALGKKDMWTW
jgi:hypothetical protein